MEKTLASKNSPMEKLVDDIKFFFPDFKISVSDFKPPKTVVIRDFYCRLLIELGIDCDNVRKIQMSQPGDCSEIDILPELNLITSIRTALPFLNIQLMDIISPDPKKTAFLMSQVMNFINFCDERCEILNKNVKEYQDKKDMERELGQLKDRISNELNILACKLDSHQQAKLELKKRIANLENELKTYTRDKEDVEQQALKKDEAMAACRKKIQFLEKELQLVSKEYEECSKQIVSNPEEEKKEFDLKCKELNRVSENKKGFHEKYISIRAEIEKYQLQLDHLNKKASPIINELDVLQQCSQFKNHDLKAQENFEEKQKKITEYNEKLSELDKKIHDTEQMFSKTSAESEKKMKDLKESLEKTKKDYKVKTKNIKMTENTSEEALAASVDRMNTIKLDYDTIKKQYYQAMEEISAYEKKMDNLWRRA